MARKCEICGKQPRVGNNVSHANNKTKRRFKPNIQRVKYFDTHGRAIRINACTRCIRTAAYLQ